MRERLRAAPRDAGQVHSVYAAALNLLWHDGRLLTLHSPGRLLAPFAAAVTRLPFGLAPVQGVRREGEELRLGPFRLRWEGSAVVETELRPEARGARFLAAALASGVGERTASGLFSPTGCVAQRQLGSSIRKQDASGFLRGALALIGLGEGLTPAGDDCLVGALAVLWRRSAVWMAEIEESRRAIAAASETGTTVVGREFLLYALAGSFSEVIVDLMNARSAAEAAERVDELGKMGASSGADTLWGMRLALEALQP